MDRYQKVEKPKPEVPIYENEIRITASGPIGNYISYATSLLQDKQAKEIVLKAMGQAISKTVAIAEIIKKRIPQLHQDTVIGSECITDVWEPIEEGLVPVEMTRHVSMISITLSTRELNKNSPGYQDPKHFEQQKPQNRYQQQECQPGGPRNSYNGPNEDSYGQESYGGYSYGRGSYGRGRGRGSGRGRSWGRGGGYINYRDNGGYSNWGRGGGRGRGWGYQDGYDNYQDGYGNYQDGGYERGGRTGGFERGSSGGYERGRGGGRGYGGGRGRMGGRGRSRGDNYD